jgi:hypothetical protein
MIGSMRDPRRQEQGGAGGQQGPFVQSRGLLGSILGRGEKPQEPQHRHEDHPPPARPLAMPTNVPAGDPRHRPLVMGTNARDLVPDPDPASGSKLLWLFRNFRIVMIIAFVVIGAGINVFDSTIGGASDPQAPSQPSTPTMSQGRYDMRVVKVAGEWVTLTDADGMRYRWRVEKPAVRAMLVRHTGTRAIMFWQQRGGETEIVGIVGPKGSVAPYADDDTTVEPVAPTPAPAPDAPTPA